MGFNSGFKGLNPLYKPKNAGFFYALFILITYNSTFACMFVNITVTFFFRDVT